MTKSRKNYQSPQQSRSNVPRNHLILDATKPFLFEYVKFGSKVRLLIHQTPNDETWPGGALWDLGVILAKLLVSWTRGTSFNQQLQPALPSSLAAYSGIAWRDTTVLELGCGVGLTGLVAASLGAKATLLTDLRVVIDEVTRRNVDENVHAKAKQSMEYRTTRAGGKVVAMPLFWGKEEDEEAVRLKLQEAVATKQKGTTDDIFPDWVIIGDVAYQHKPGAPSHFDALLSTLSKFVGPNTKVLFGTRMRMPASNDLLEMFRNRLEETACVPAHELEPSLTEIGRKHNMTIHILQQRGDERTPKAES
jgi:predicted nicotinamide N-methyase